MDIKYPFSDVQLNSDILSWWREDVYFEEKIKINIYEFVYKNLKQWAKLKNVFDKIDWSEEPEQIFKKAEKLKNEIN